MNNPKGSMLDKSALYPHSYDEIAEEAESYCMLVVDYIKLNILSD